MLVSHLFLDFVFIKTSGALTLDCGIFQLFSYVRRKTIKQSDYTFFSLPFVEKFKVYLNHQVMEKKSSEKYEKTFEQLKRYKKLSMYTHISC